MAVLHNPREVSVTQATQRGVAGLGRRCGGGLGSGGDAAPSPYRAVVSMGRLAELEEAAGDLRDLALVLARAVTDTGRRTSLDDILHAFGQARSGWTRYRAMRS